MFHNLWNIIYDSGETESSSKFNLDISRASRAKLVEWQRISPSDKPLLPAFIRSKRTSSVNPLTIKLNSSSLQIPKSSYITSLDEGTNFNPPFGLIICKISIGVSSSSMIMVSSLSRCKYRLPLWPTGPIQNENSKTFLKNEKIVPMLHFFWNLKFDAMCELLILKLRMRQDE